ncbi:MAG: glucose-6-phosphate isomerase [Bacteroidales bacterium]
MKSIIEIDFKGVTPFVESGEIELWCEKALNSLNLLIEEGSNKSSPTDWIDLPTEDFTSIFKRFDSLKREWLSKGVEFVVSVGVGGSYQGARAFYEAFVDSFHTFDKREGLSLVFAGHTLSPLYLSELLQFLKKREFAVVVISKSGDTLESAVALNLLRGELQRRYGTEEEGRRIAAVTSIGKGALWEIAHKEGWHLYDIPKGVGGRFSLFTSAALLPLSLAGIDVKEIIRGAADGRALSLVRSIENGAVRYAAVRNLLYSKGKKIEVMAAYTPKLYFFLEWWRQLFGESEGKRGRAIFPTIACYTTDLHSLGQYLQEGERTIFETVLSFGEQSGKEIIERVEGNSSLPHYLEGVSIGKVNSIVKEGVAKAHIEGGLPLISIEGGLLREYNLGALAYLFQFSVALSAKLLGVDPFNQPGVEAYKRESLYLLKGEGE